MGSKVKPQRERVTWPGDPEDEPQRRHEKEVAEEKARRERAPKPAESGDDRE
jgi:hypothetical protein